MSVAESLLQDTRNQKYAHLDNAYRSSQLALCLDEAQSWFTSQLTLIKSGEGVSRVSGKQRYDLYRANLLQVTEKKAKEAIAWKHPRDAVREQSTRVCTENELVSHSNGLALSFDYDKYLTDGSFCPVSYDENENSFAIQISEAVPEFARVQESAIKIPVPVPLSLSARLSFEPPRQYYAPPNLVAPKISSLQYDFMTECQWRNVKPYWTQLLKALTEKLIADSQDSRQESMHFLAYALSSTFPGGDFGYNEDTIELRLQGNKNFVCLKAANELIKGDILIARGSNSTHSAIYFGEDRIMSSLGKDKGRPCYMLLSDFIHHADLSEQPESLKIYRFCA